MISNYIFYLYTLSNEEKFKELCLLFIFFIVLFIISMIFNTLSLKFKKFDKNIKPH